tara:strand:- start:107 stop:565 length:459 start_codon:yes stop_codon:yes gene_type:complete
MVESIRAHKLIGTAGELFTAFELTMIGVQCDLVKQDGTDVVAIKGNKVLLAQRIEVKTSTYVDEKKCYSFSVSKGGKKRRYTKEDCDIIALVALPERKIQFISVGLIRGITKKVHINTFRNDTDLISRSWDNALKKSLEESRLVLEDWYKNK